MSGDRLKWEERYSRKSATPAAPSRFLIDWAHCLRSPVLDVAGGDGRNALYLARRGLTVHVIDIAHNALVRVRQSAQSEGLPVVAIQADLEAFPLPRHYYGGVVVVRYLQRSLFDALRQTLRPGAVLIYETFLKDQQTIGHPTNPHHLLEPGELFARFCDFEVVFYEEGLLDEAPPAYLARLVARRPLRRQRCATEH
ncbi:MAG: hypothetical protein KatS3mg077_2994 [Candidatus Binatia bacterium]|nr:MAG: hypothetical protein KatS3mg077_2994 [Candidatus Binatia bacterium]